MPTFGMSILYHQRLKRTSTIPAILVTPHQALPFSGTQKEAAPVSRLLTHCWSVNNSFATTTISKCVKSSSVLIVLEANLQT